MRACLIVVLLLVQGLAATAATAKGAESTESADTASTPEAAGTTIYRTTDADGNVVFTDNPPRDRHAEAVHLKPTNSMPMGASGDHEASADGDASTAKSKPVFDGYTNLSITSPKDGATLRNPEKPVAVTVRLDPALQSGDRVRIFDNGEPLEARGLENPDRGSHTLQAEVVGKDGGILIRSPSITVYVHRTSVSDQGGGTSGSGVASFGDTANTGDTSSYGGASRSGKAAGEGGASSFGHAASAAPSLTPSQ